MNLALVPAADVPVVPDFFTQIFSGATGVVALVFYILLAVAWWKVFTKAGYPGILALIPIVNAIFLLRIAGMSGWWVLLYLVPIANVVLAIVVAVKVGARFGKGGVFSFFLLFVFSFVGYFILGFGDSRYSKA
ncbi:DUF5684 domain-containing protein [Microbacterium sp. MYb66]|jgi:hypothetical protein|uniref:DUF5684 domain-containing protein n=1 Tax=Microbacterium sp. MYb66 TaxID=1848692 RepID=UPI001C61296B|nr:DUF5684 domain-containing protein [Microbacterium sp. MYb66]